VSRRLWRCRNAECGAVLGHITADDVVALDPGVHVVRVYFDTSKAAIACPKCGTVREFRGRAILID